MPPPLDHDHAPALVDLVQRRVEGRELRSRSNSSTCNRESKSAPMVRALSGTVPKSRGRNLGHPRCGQGGAGRMIVARQPTPAANHQGDRSCELPDTAHHRHDHGRNRRRPPGRSEATAATPAPGTFKGQTGQGRSIKLTVERSLTGMFVRRVSVTGTADCDYGLPSEEAGIRGLVLGVKVRRGRFHIQTVDLDLRGRFVTSKRIEGRLDLRDDYSPCETKGIGYHAIRR